MVRRAKSAARTLGASAVTNMLLVTQVTASAVYIRYAPILRALSSLGRDPYNSGILRRMGKIVPPLRAVLDGMNGERARSAKAMAYPRPKVRFPRARISIKAMRFPRPVLE